MGLLTAEGCPCSIRWIDRFGGTGAVTLSQMCSWQLRVRQNDRAIAFDWAQERYCVVAAQPSIRCSAIKKLRYSRIFHRRHFSCWKSTTAGKGLVDNWPGRNLAVFVFRLDGPETSTKGLAAATVGPFFAVVLLPWFGSSNFCVPADFAPPNFPAWKIRRLKIREESLGGLVQKPHEIAAITAHRRATPPAVAGSRPAIRREGVASVVLAFVPHAPLTESELMLPVHERRRGAGSRPVEWLSICGGSVSAAILRRM
jgi:hypothetical protein